MATDSSSDPLAGVDLGREHLKNRVFVAVCFGASVFGLVTLAFLIGDIIWEAAYGIVTYDISVVEFLTNVGSTVPSQAGLFAAIMGSILLVFFTAIFAFVIGVGTAIYLVEYAPDNRLTRLIDANLANLAGVPSVVYGLVVLGLLVNNLGFGRIILVGSLALALLVMPIIIVAAMEALRAVPDGVRDGSRAMGATKWQTIRRVVLPTALPGILTGTILALARAIGETAPLLMVGALVGARHAPWGPFDRITAMTVTIFEWAFEFDAHFHALAALGIVVLLIVLLGMNGIAIYLRNRYETEV